MASKKTLSLRVSSNNIDVVIAQFGQDVTRKLRTGHGSGEDHLRGPFEQMLRDVAASLGLPVTTIGETRLPDLSIRPDYAIDVAGVRVGYVELKKPGHGVPETWKRPSKHDKEQWEKFKLLPNVLYSDGERFCLYSFGKPSGQVACLAPGLDHAGGELHAVDTEFARVITEFLLWKPERPRTLEELVRLIANLCRLLREDVTAELVREQVGHSKSQVFSGLASDWRQVLFPNLTDVQFADQYAQTVTFALLLARVEGISFEGRSLGDIARLLGKKHSLMGKALAVLTDQNEDERSVALTTMIRVVAVVDWEYFPEDSYAMLYESFLAKYDPLLRKKSGVYYTPAPVVSFMTRFVDEILRVRLGRELGFAEDDVIVVDPAMGTGSFLAEVINKVAGTVADEEGVGSVTPRLRDLSNRLIGFENQAAPYAVSELRIHSLLKKRHRSEIPLKERRFLADTLDDPNVQLLPMGSMYEAIERSRKGANLVKREEPVMVVIGNPPYADRIKGYSRWIETHSDNREASPSLSAFKSRGKGRLEYVLSNMYVYFWRWATWKAFDAHPDRPAGVVAMICSAGFTSGPGFAGMREYLRQTADEGWIIDLSPEGHQSPVNTRVFQGNQQPICIAIFIRQGEPEPAVPARVHRVSVSGTFDEKMDSIKKLTLDGSPWGDCAEGWDVPFQLPGREYWQTLPTISQLMPWSSPGVKPNRTWVYAPEESSLRIRWHAVTNAVDEVKSNLFEESRDANLTKIAPRLAGVEHRNYPFSAESGDMPAPVRVAYRSFDRQYLISDARLIATPRSSLWGALSDSQVFLTEQHAQVTTAGPGVTFTSLLPDMHHFNGRGGRAFPLYRDAAGKIPNLSPGLLQVVSDVLNIDLGASDVLAYFAGISAHPGYVDRFSEELRKPCIRIPLTRNPTLWHRAVEIGREVLWLHTYGERYSDPSAGRPRRAPRLEGVRPRVQVAIPDMADGMPAKIEYDEGSETLKVGVGRISPVSLTVWSYQVSGMSVIKHWFGYRKKNPSGNRKSELSNIVAESWTPAMTTELLDLLNVLGRCVELEPRQVELLDDVMRDALVTVKDLESAGIIPVPLVLTKPPKPDKSPPLWE